MSAAGRGFHPRCLEVIHTRCGLKGTCNVPVRYAPERGSANGRRRPIAIQVRTAPVT